MHRHLQVIEHFKSLQDLWLAHYGAYLILFTLVMLSFSFTPTIAEIP